VPTAAAPPVPTLASEVAAVRAFNRFYTRRIGVVSNAPLGSGPSLTESRVLYELAHSDQLTASALIGDLGLDQGYLSRILRRFEKEGLLKRTRSKADKRQSHLVLTRKGHAAYARIERAWQKATEAMLAPLPVSGRRDLVTSMLTVETLLGAKSAQRPVTLRAPRIGDMGWLVHRHAVNYAQEFGWNDEFEALVAEILAAFIRNYDAACEQCWIAELDGAPVGSVFLVKESEEMGRLRLLFVEPSARGHGIGRLLVDACIDQAGRVGYRKLTLWTNDVLASARRIYEAAGFQLVKEWPDRKFGNDLVGQDWELTL